MIAGDGPCNRERLADRRAAHDDGAWVRDAALAYAEKRQVQGYLASFETPADAGSSG